MAFLKTKKESLKDNVLTDVLTIKLDKIIDKITSTKQLETIRTEIIEYFYILCNSIFDVFVCEGEKEDKYIKDLFEIFYFDIFLNQLREIFVKNTYIKNYFDNNPDTALYITCENSLFEYISNYYYNPENNSPKNLELLLKLMIEFDSSKIDIYKSIMFRHRKSYAKSVLHDAIGCIDNEMESQDNKEIIERMKKDKEELLAKINYIDNIKQEDYEKGIVDIDITY
ncbi:MAG: hypothetical protein ACRC5M_06740 [Anaeroplasmataceae bacterium]